MIFAANAIASPDRTPNELEMKALKRSMQIDKTNINKQIGEVI